MCGITGFVASKKLPSSELLKMNEAIKHRGPDDEGYFFSGKHFSGADSPESVKARFPQLKNDLQSDFGMGFRRLSILDLSDNGHQPMISPKGNIITFNGEIYNYRELREELQAEGHRFTSSTDTEVVLIAFEQWGKDSVKRLDGMFSFCIWNPASEKLFFARDRVGLKPFFYFQNENGFFWASEIKALLASGCINSEINWEGVHSNFTYLTTVSPQTCFLGIFSLQPGLFAEFDIKTKDFVREQYYKLPKAGQNKAESAEAVLKIDQLLQSSVARQLRADVPVSSMMSGGIDSTLATVIAVRINPGISAFTVNYKNADEEIINAQAVANENYINHETVNISSEEILKQLKEDIAHFEEPYSTPEVLLHAAKYARDKGHKVIFSGNGADELFGGYPHLQGFNKWRNSRKFSFFADLLPGKGGFLGRLRNYLSLENAADFFRNGQGGMKPFEIDELFNIKINTPEISSGNSYQDYFERDMSVSLGSHHAFRDDLSAMKYSVEFRYPYLSNELIDYVAGLPEEMRFTGEINKPLLRKVAGKYLADQVLNMKKKGFVYPLQAWYEEDENLRSFISDHIKALISRKIFRKSTIEKWHSDILAGSNLSKVWQLVTFEIWLQTYFDRGNSKNSELCAP